MSKDLSGGQGWRLGIYQDRPARGPPRGCRMHNQFCQVTEALGLTTKPSYIALKPWFVSFRKQALPLRGGLIEPEL